MATSIKTCKVKTELRNNSALQVWMKANVVLKRMEGNPYFPLPNPSIERVELYRNKLGAILKLDDTELQLVQRNEAQKKLADALTRLAALVQNVGSGNAEIILSTGFGVRKSRTKAHVLSAPVMKRYIKMQQHGCVKLMWKANTKSSSYFVYLSEADKPEERKMITMSTRSSTIIKDLESGKKYLLQVSTLNSAGESGLSNPATVYEAWL